MGIETRIIGKDPLRIIVDSKLEVPLEHNIFLDNNVLIATTSDCDKKKKFELEKRGITVLEIEKSNQRVNLKKLMEELGKRQIMSVLLEGGSEMNASAFNEGIINRVFFFISPKMRGRISAMCYGLLEFTILIRGGFFLVLLKRFTLKQKMEEGNSI